MTFSAGRLQPYLSAPAPPFIERLPLIAPAANLKGYWPLLEPTGSVVTDYSGNGFHGTYSGPTAYTGVAPYDQVSQDGDGVRYFDGVNDDINVFGTPLQSAWSFAVGTLACMVRIPPAGWVTGNGNTGVSLRFEANSNSLIQIDTLSTNRDLRFIYFAGGVQEVMQISTFTNYPGWMPVAISFDKPNDIVRAFAFGAQVGSATGLGTVASAITKARIGSGGVASSWWLGNIAHVAWWNIALSDDQHEEYAAA